MGSQFKLAFTVVPQMVSPYANLHVFNSLFVACWQMNCYVGSLGKGSQKSHTAVSQQGHRYLTAVSVIKTISQWGHRELTDMRVTKTISQWGHRYLTDMRVTKAISQWGHRELTDMRVTKTISQWGHRELTVWGSQRPSHSEVTESSRCEGHKGHLTGRSQWAHGDIFMQPHR